MSFLEQATTAQERNGLKIMIYGEPKVGKSYFGAQIPNHIFLNLENGLEYLEGANKLPFTDRYEVVCEMLKELATTDHPYKTLVIDSADVLENLIKKWIVAQQNNVQLKDIAEIPFGKGYPLLMTETRKLISKLEYLSTHKKMNIVLICHSEVKKMQPPVGNEYTYIAPSLYAKTSQGDSTLKIYTDWLDILGYCEYKRVVSQTSNGKGQAKGTGERIMHIEAGNPAYVSGSRLSLPSQLPFDWNALKQAIKESINKGE